MRPFLIAILVFQLLLICSDSHKDQNIYEPSYQGSSIFSRNLQSSDSILAAAQKIDQDMENTRITNEQLAQFLSSLENVRRDLNATMNKFGQEQVKQQYKNFFYEMIGTILENVLVIMVVASIVALGGFFLYMYLTRWRYPGRPPKQNRNRGNEIYIQSQHSSSTNLETNSDRALQPTI